LTRWNFRCAFDGRRVRVLIDIPFEVHNGRPKAASASASASDSGAAAGAGRETDGSRHDPGQPRERLASTEAKTSVTSEGSSQELPSPSLPDDPASYLLEHEPIPQGGAIDYRYQFELMRDRVEREADRGKGLDGKIASILAGIVASIGFSLRLDGSVVTNLAAMLYLFPMITLFLAFRTQALLDAPKAESILRYFETYPVSLLKEGVNAMMTAIKKNRSINDRKANLFDRAVLLTIIATTIVLVAQVALAAYKGYYFVK